MSRRWPATGNYTYIQYFSSNIFKATVEPCCVWSISMRTLLWCMGIILVLWYWGSSLSQPNRTPSTPTASSPTQLPAVSAPVVPREIVTTAPIKPAVLVQPKPTPEPRSVAAPELESIPAPSKGPSDAEIVQHLMARSAAIYSGNCRCPEDTDRDRPVAVVVSAAPISGPEEPLHSAMRRMSSRQ